MKVVFCIPTRNTPHPACIASVEAAVPVLDRAGIEHQMVSEVGCPYISHARATMLRKALDANADAVVFIDDDVAFTPTDMLKLVQTKGDVVAGTYRFKLPEEKYMATIVCDARGYPVCRTDGCIRADKVPAGFLKVTREAVRRFMRAFPDLVYGDPEHPSVDLFNHGAHKGVWFGEDYAFSRRYLEAGGDIWLVPDLDLTHHAAEVAYPGNFHKFMLRRPGGSESACPVPPERRAA